MLKRAFASGLVIGVRNGGGNQLQSGFSSLNPYSSDDVMRVTQGRQFKNKEKSSASTQLNRDLQRPNAE